MYNKKTLFILYSLFVLWIISVFSIDNNGVRMIIFSLMCFIAYNLGKIDKELEKLRKLVQNE